MEMVKYYTDEGEILVDLDAPKAEPEQPQRVGNIKFALAIVLLSIAVFWATVYGVVALISNHSW